MSVSTRVPSSKPVARGTCWRRFMLWTALATLSFSIGSMWIQMYSSLDDLKEPLAILRQLQQEQVRTPKIVIATSLTQCPDAPHWRTWLLDTAAVLEHSIHLTSAQSKYEYDLMAFVHPTAVNCSNVLRQAGYQVLIRDTPIDPDAIQNVAYRDKMIKSGCCGEKEFLKLYAYTLHEYPVVIHLDMDIILLKPYDDLIDAFLASNDVIKPIPDAMWPRQRISRVGAIFTRDYTTGIPGSPHEKFNMQGGFFMVRPNQTVFEEMRQIVLRGNFDNGWYDGNVHFRKSYGGETIQGLLAFYYGHYHPEQLVEVDGCVHNQMAIEPVDKSGKCFAVVNFTSNECHRDCRLMNVQDIHSIHFTNCGKPYWCFPQDHFSWNDRAVAKSRLCLDFHEEWFRLRHSLDARLGISTESRPEPNDRTFGHCDFNQTEPTAKYQPINWTLAKATRTISRQIMEA